MWAAVEPGLQHEVVLPDPRPSAGVDYLTAPESGKPGGDISLQLLLMLPVGSQLQCSIR